MKITHNQNSRLVVFRPETSAEADLLDKFPGFVRQGLSFFCPSKANVVHNLYQRLRKVKGLAKSVFKMGQSVIDLLNGDRKLKELPADFKFHTDPLRHQMIALRWLYTFGSGGLLLDPGLGKTKVVLDYIVLMGFGKCLIICPKALLFVWQDEVARHRPDKSVYVIQSTDWAAEAEKAKNADIVVVNYNKAVILEAELSTMRFDFIAVDEALIKDPSSQRTKAVTAIGENVRYKVLMSGTLINNTPLDLYAPVRFVEPALVGYSWPKFRDEYAVVQDLKQGEDKKIPIIVGCRRVPEMRSILESVSIVMTKEEWLDLPPKQFIDVPVAMTDMQQDAYRKLSANYIVELQGEIIEADNPLALAAKLVQLANGFAYITDDDSLADLFCRPSKDKKKRRTFYFPEQAKAAALINLIKTKLQGRRGIIWYNMSAELEIIRQVLDAGGISYLVIKGGEKDTGGKVHRFNEDPSIDWLLCQAKAVNYGITVLGKSAEDLEEMDIVVPPGITPEVYTHIFYSLNFSGEVYLQQQDRSHRIGQTHACEYYRLISNSPIERHIVKTLEKKKSIRNEMLVDYINKMKEREERHGRGDARQQQLPIPGLGDSDL